MLDELDPVQRKVVQGYLSSYCGAVQTSLWLSKELRVSPTTVSKWCRNEMRSTVESLLNVANALPADVSKVCVKFEKGINVGVQLTGPDIRNMPILLPLSGKPDRAVYGFPDNYFIHLLLYLSLFYFPVSNHKASKLLVVGRLKSSAWLVDERYEIGNIKSWHVAHATPRLWQVISDLYANAN